MADDQLPEIAAADRQLMDEQLERLIAANQKVRERHTSDMRRLYREFATGEGFGDVIRERLDEYDHREDVEDSAEGSAVENGSRSDGAAGSSPGSDAGSTTS